MRTCGQCQHYEPKFMWPAEGFCGCPLPYWTKGADTYGVSARNEVPDCEAFTAKDNTQCAAS